MNLRHTVREIPQDRIQQIQGVNMNKNFSGNAIQLSSEQMIIRHKKGWLSYALDRYSSQDTVTFISYI